MSLRELTAEERQQAYGIAREEWMATKGRPLRAMRRTRSRLAGIGWEAIAIQVAIMLIQYLFKKWRESKDDEPAAAMPEDVATMAFKPNELDA